MSSVPLSLYYKSGRPVGFRKYIHRKSFVLAYGTTAEDRKRAEALARVFLAKAEQLQLLGRPWDDASIAECKAAAPASPPQPLAPPPPAVAGTNGWMLYDVIEKYRQAEEERVVARKTSEANARNHRSQILWAKDGIENQPMRNLVLADLKRWVGHFTARPISKRYRRRISAYSASAVCRTIRHFLDWADAEEYYLHPRRWTDAFKGIHPKRLMDREEKNREKREGFKNFTLLELQILWTLATPECRPFLGIGLWAGHTQHEIATIALHGEFVKRDGEYRLERDRNKTGVWGQWWLPPEVGACIEAAMAKTTADRKRNSEQSALLTRGHKKLVRFAETGRHQRCDHIAQYWETLLRRAANYGVRHISFKHLRKTMAQQVRNRLGAEFATLFSAEKLVIGAVQDESYTNACFPKLDACLKEIYAEWKVMFQKCNWDDPRIVAMWQQAKKKQDAA